MKRNLYRNFRRRCICVTLGFIPFAAPSITEDIAEDFDREVDIEFGDSLPTFIGFLVVFIFSGIDVFFEKTYCSEGIIEWASDDIPINDKERLILLNTILLSSRWQKDAVVARLKEHKQKIKERILITKLAGL